jgi:hypothetical protein
LGNGEQLVFYLRRSLLLLIVILGLVSAIAFSSSYQLVARFANKSVIALGLGCVGSGIVVLLLELAVGMKTRPTTSELIWLFELTAGQDHVNALCTNRSSVDSMLA